MEAIQAATIVPARVMGVDKETGTVGAGKRADLIVIDGDPLADIRNTRNVELVVTGGKCTTVQTCGGEPGSSHG